CGLPLPEGARFCPNCGAAVGPLVETEERKMVTVLFADLVDSTGLAQRLDPERARDLLGRFFDVASEELMALRGRPEKFIGDAVMAVFGLPHVHEDDAIRAVRAGLALVGMTTYLLTSANVAYARRRRVRAKGFDSSLDAFGVDALTPRSARRTIPFVGRTSEQAILGQSLGVASTSGRPVLATVVGESGIGKSRLADELAAGVSAAVLILRGQSRALTDTATFSPAAAIIGDLAGVRSGDGPDEVRQRLVELAGRVSDARASGRTAQRLALLFGQAGSRDETAFVSEVQAGFISVIDGL